MARLIKNILHGMRQVLVMYPDVDYVRPTRGGFYADMKLLRKDSELIIHGLRKNTLTYGQQIDHR